MDYLIIVLIMFISGSFGGCISYFLNEKKTVLNKLNFVKSIAFGIAAAFIVPLFLNLISSNLMDKMDAKNLLVFTGICLLMSIYSKSFIKVMSSKLLKQLEEKTEEVDGKINILIDKDAAPDAEEKVNAVIEGQSAAVKGIPVKNSIIEDIDKKIITENIAEAFYAINQEIQTEDDVNIKIIKAVGNSGYSFMTADRFASETKLAKWQVENILEDLIHKGLVGELPKDDKVYYFLTAKGKIELKRVNK